MVAYTKPQQSKKEESEKLRGERDQIKFIDLRCERGQVVGFRKAIRGQETFHKEGNTFYKEGKIFYKEGKTFYKKAIHSISGIMYE